MVLETLLKVRLRVELSAVALILAAAEQVVAAEFIAKDRASLEALKSANLLKSIDINALIVGDTGVGKKTLANYIINAPIIDGGDDIESIIKSLQQNRKLIIKNFDKIKHIDIFETELNSSKTRIIATASRDIYNPLSDKFFSLKINLPPLSERKRDVYVLSKKFLKEVEDIFDIKSSVDLKRCKIDLSRNCYSLRESIYKEVIKRLLRENDIMSVMEEILKSRLGSKDDYRKNLYLYEIPLINAGKSMFKSQLKMAEEFGINRNTLRKKINEYKIKI